MWKDVYKAGSVLLVFQEEKLQAHVAHDRLMATKPSTSMEESRAMYGSYSGASFSSSFDPDNIALDRHPIYSGYVQSPL